MSDLAEQLRIVARSIDRGDAAPDTLTIRDAADELEALRRDAERYRWLRNKANDTHKTAPMAFNCNPSELVSWTDALCGAKLDAAIDEAMEKR